MIRKLSSGGYRLYSRKKDPKTGKRRNLGTFKTRAAAESMNGRCNTSSDTHSSQPKRSAFTLLSLMVERANPLQPR
jgi:hypothetical protein